MSESRTRSAGATAWRDLPCGDVDEEAVGRTVRLAGWVHRRRDLGGVVFLHLRDRTGLVQLAFNPDWTPGPVVEQLGDLNPEDVIAVGGRVEMRPADAVNPDMETGRVEVRVEAMERVSEAAPLPILVAIPPDEELPSEELRLRHRVLDLRRPEMQRNFRIRHLAANSARRALADDGFLEIETPFLTRRTPEGARDYLVPSRIHPGEFYALPQSPQLYKQLLMVAGFDRYFQIARCLRDEDLRADRQPEFTQIDVEMAFVDEDDVFAAAERMLARVLSEAVGIDLGGPVPRMTHADALEHYGTDKPDLRIPWRLEDFTDALSGLGFGIIDGVRDAGGRVRGFRVPGGAAISRSRLDSASATAQANGAKGALWLKRSETGWSGPPARFLEGEPGDRLAAAHGIEPGDLALMVAGPDSETSPSLDALRRTIAADEGAVEEGLRWTWITDFPLFEADPDTGMAVASHHPFTMPDVTEPERLLSDPFSVGSRAYDLVLNGTELCSGSIRCHRPDLQRAILKVLGMGEDEIESRFGFLLESFRYGVPPHGGFAMGFDRLVAMLVGTTSIREVIAFPKTTAARGLLEGAPSPLAADELIELGLSLR
ncbi:MAG: aspartate--tRNA ligase [marine benthic group bacterium]|nr:aspartate--tRNA ligase [Gemmatimonadota bacterium]